MALKAVQELLRHATNDMTMLRYPHFSPDVKRDAVQLLDRPLDSGARSAPTLGANGGGAT